MKQQGQKYVQQTRPHLPIIPPAVEASELEQNVARFLQIAQEKGNDVVLISKSSGFAGEYKSINSLKCTNINNW